MTGVQTCALPISAQSLQRKRRPRTSHSADPGGPAGGKRGAQEVRRQGCLFRFSCNPAAGALDTHSSRPPCPHRTRDRCHLTPGFPLSVAGAGGPEGGNSWETPAPRRAAPREASGGLPLLPPGAAGLARRPVPRIRLPSARAEPAAQPPACAPEWAPGTPRRTAWERGLRPPQCTAAEAAHFRSGGALVPASLQGTATAHEIGRASCRERVSSPV